MEFKEKGRAFIRCYRQLNKEVEIWKESKFHYVKETIDNQKSSNAAIDIDVKAFDDTHTIVLSRSVEDLFGMSDKEDEIYLELKIELFKGVILLVFTHPLIDILKGKVYGRNGKIVGCLKPSEINDIKIFGFISTFYSNSVEYLEKEVSGDDIKKPHN